MGPIELEHLTTKGERLRAVFLPEKGMNMISFKKGDLEVIDQSTWPLFEERYAGLGALIGPHFFRRRKEVLPVIKNEALFPHIARVKAKGVNDPFSHGIARYAPWKAEVKGTSVKAQLTGKDLWNGVPVAELEGQQFTMGFEASLKEDGLYLNLSIVSETSSLVGIHYYYALPGGKGRVISDVQEEVRINRELHQIPTGWNYRNDHLIFDLTEEADFTFYPYPNPLSGTIMLETEGYRLRTTYDCASAENGWQLYHPKGGSFACIEPLSAQDPLHPNLTVSSLNIHLEILTDSSD